MSRSRALFELERIDRQIEEHERRLEAIAAELHDGGGLDDQRAELDRLQQERRAVLGQLQDLELAVESRRSLVRADEQKLFSGSVRSPKELQDLSKKIEQHKATIRQLEDEELELMARQEALDQAIAAARSRYGEAERAWKERQASLTAERAALTGEVEALRRQRAAHASAIPPADLRLYDLLHNDTRHQAVSLVKRATCQVCHVSLPASELHRARVPTDLVRCSSCGRILYVT